MLLAQSDELHCVRENTHLVRRIGWFEGLAADKKHIEDVVARCVAEGTVGETAQTMRAVRDPTPQITRTVAQTTVHVERLTRSDWPVVRVLKTVAPIAAGTILGTVK